MVDRLAATLGVIGGEMAFHELDQTVHLGAVGIQAGGHAGGIGVALAKKASALSMPNWVSSCTATAWETSGFLRGVSP